MAQKKTRIIMVGAFPPPIHGMAAVNAGVKNALRQACLEPIVITVGAMSLDRAFVIRLGRLPRVLGGLVRLITLRGLRGQSLYMSVSGGAGQIYEVAYLLVARLRRMRLFLHHHSFSYLGVQNRRTTLLVRAAGARAVHVALSASMENQLRKLYGIEVVVTISNAVFLMQSGTTPVQPRPELKTVGFISNLTREKGVLEFLDLLAAARETGLPIVGKLAGPFQDPEAEYQVRLRLASLPNVEYVGPKYGKEKELFLSEIDALIFPTRYVNEAEPLTLHEAMSRGIPVIAYGRGCIPELVSSTGGKVIDPADRFVPGALSQLKAWRESPATFCAASSASARRCRDVQAQSARQWNVLLNDLMGCMNANAEARGEKTDWP